MPGSEKWWSKGGWSEKWWSKGGWQEIRWNAVEDMKKWKSISKWIKWKEENERARKENQETGVKENMENPQENGRYQKICRTALRRWIKSKNKKASNQKSASNKMKDMAQSMQNSMQQQEKEQHEEDKDHTPDPRESCKRILRPGSIDQRCKCHDDQYLIIMTWCSSSLM